MRIYLGEMEDVMKLSNVIMLLMMTILLALVVACSSDGDSTPKATSAPKVETYSGCKELEHLMPKLAMPGSVTLSYYQVVQIGKNDICDNIIKKVNKPENLKD